MASRNTTGLNETFDPLTHPYRRYVLYHLTEKSEVVDVETLATAVDEWDAGHTGTDRSNDADDVEIALRHTHLPKLADAGAVTFEAGDVELGETDGISPFLVETARMEGYARTAADD